MSYLNALILGFVEGITEFLPISSTFHLLLTNKLLGLANSPFSDALVVIIQSGALAAALFLYGKKILSDKRLLLLLLISFVPTALIGFLFNDLIKSFFFVQTSLSTVVFILVGLIFLQMESWEKKAQEKNLNLTHITYQRAALIGLAQSLAIVPGVSRIGAIVIGMQLLGFSRKTSAEYGFMLGIPTIFAAGALDLSTLVSSNILTSSNSLVLLASWLMSFFVALAAIKWLIGYLQEHSFALFGWYRLAFGILILFLIR